MSPVFKIKSKKIVIRCNCNHCPYLKTKTYTFGLQRRIKRFCQCQMLEEIKNKRFDNRRIPNDEINWFPDWCPLEDD